MGTVCLRIRPMGDRRRSIGPLRGRQAFAATAIAPLRDPLSDLGGCPVKRWRIQPVVATMGFSGCDNSRCMA